MKNIEKKHCRYTVKSIIIGLYLSIYFAHKKYNKTCHSGNEQDTKAYGTLPYPIIHANTLKRRKLWTTVVKRAELSADSDDNLFECILSNSHHVLNRLLPDKTNHEHNLPQTTLTMC